MPSKFLQPIETKSNLLQAYKDRLEEAKILLQQGRYGGSIYLGGYAVEILLKCVICTLLKEDQLPKIYAEHDLEALLIAAGLRTELKNPSLKATFARWVEVCSRWDVENRYKPSSEISAAEAKKFIENIIQPNEGVEQWLLKKI